MQRYWFLGFLATVLFASVAQAQGLLLGVGGGGGYVAPVFNGQVKLFGESNLGLGSQNVFGSQNYSANVGGSSGWIGGLPGDTGNKAYYTATHQFAKVGQATVGLAGKINSARWDDGVVASAAAGASVTNNTLTINTFSGTYSNFHGFHVGEAFNVTGCATFTANITAYGTGVGKTGTYTFDGPSQGTLTNCTATATTNPGFAITSASQDGEWSSQGQGTTSVLADPANFVIYDNMSNNVVRNTSSNVTTIGQWMTLAYQMLDAFTKQGATVQIGGTQYGYVTGLAQQNVTSVNNHVLVLNTFAQGPSETVDEVHTISNATPSFQVTTTTAPWDGQCLDSLGVNHLDHLAIMANYTNLVGSGGANHPFTWTSSTTPAVGQFHTDTAGNYTFNATDGTTGQGTGRNISVNYCFGGPLWAAFTTEAKGWMDWWGLWQSSAPAYVGFGTGNAYTVPGALYNHPGVSFLETALLNADLNTFPKHSFSGATIIAGGNANCDPGGTPGLGNPGCQLAAIPGTTNSSGHYTAWGAVLNSPAIAAAVTPYLTTPNVAIYIPTPNQNNIPLWSNVSGSSWSSASCTVGCQVSGVALTQAQAIHAGTAPGPFEICISQPTTTTACAVDNTGSISCAPCNLTAAGSIGTFVPGGTCTLTGTMTYSTGAWTLASSCTSSRVPNNEFVAYTTPIMDAAGNRKTKANLVVNGQLDWQTWDGGGQTRGGTLTSLTGAACNTAGLGTSASNYVPQGWTLTGDATLQTALGNGSAILTCKYVTSQDGNPAFEMDLYGVNGSAGTLKLTSTVYYDGGGTACPVECLVNPALGDKTKGFGQMVMMKGQADDDAVRRVYGVTMMNVAIGNKTSVASTVNGIQCLNATPSCLTLNGNSTESDQYYSSNALNSGSGATAYRQVSIITAPVPTQTDLGSSTTLATSGALSATFQPNLNPNAPVSANMRFQNLGYEVYP